MRIANAELLERIAGLETIAVRRSQLSYFVRASTRLVVCGELEQSIKACETAWRWAWRACMPATPPPDLETRGRSAGSLPPRPGEYRVGSMLVKPVTLPPGSGKLATKPLPTGSETLTNTIGIVRVCCSSAAVVGVISERRRSGCSSTSSFADRLMDPKSAGIGQRILIRMLRPAAQSSS